MLKATTYADQLRGFLVDVEEKLRFKQTRIKMILKTIYRTGEGRDRLRREIDDLAFNVGQMESAKIKLIVELVLQEGKISQGRTRDGEWGDADQNSRDPESPWKPAGYCRSGARGSDEENRGPR